MKIQDWDLLPSTTMNTTSSLDYDNENFMFWAYSEHFNWIASENVKKKFSQKIASIRKNVGLPPLNCVFYVFPLIWITSAPDTAILWKDDASIKCLLQQHSFIEQNLCKQQLTLRVVLSVLKYLKMILIDNCVKLSVEQSQDC